MPFRPESRLQIAVSSHFSETADTTKVLLQDHLTDRVAENRVAYQGMPGAFSEQAAKLACPDSETTPCEQFEMAFQLLSQWLVERAVLPIENAQGGSIHAVYDLLMRCALHLPLPPVQRLLTLYDCTHARQ